MADQYIETDPLLDALDRIAPIQGRTPIAPILPPTIHQEPIARLTRCPSPERIREIAQSGDRTGYRAEIIHMNGCGDCRSALLQAETTHRRGRSGYVG